ncbi:HAD-IIIA family hydrolase [bacterium]|nr:HAD-IIIA family hydrolase [bacterium]
MKVKRQVNQLSKEIEEIEELKGDIGVFIDRDGTINIAGAGEYITSWPMFKFIPGTLEAFATLAKLPVKILIVTNQSAVHRGLITKYGIELIHGMMEFEIVSNGGRIDGLKYCPHTAKENCDCRKPKTLLFEELAKEHAIDIERSINIGDHIRDMQAGNDLGMTNIMVRTGHGKMMNLDMSSHEINIHYVVDDLKAASEIIVKELKM